MLSGAQVFVSAEWPARQKSGTKLWNISEMQKLLAEKCARSGPDSAFIAENEMGERTFSSAMSDFFDENM